MIEVEEKISGGATEMDDVLLASRSNCHAEEFCATIGHANTNAVVVADFRT
jgi:dihydroxyacid dehydratase/phosphogluconate dehydratase